ncbi:hypothetical protein, partial [Burkholderia sp. BDU5]|uniref:hypothetical protein n=1 Tax=Burkholderia sp. BDU5 TaxID=1385590 RepID=UPI0018D22D8C
VKPVSDITDPPPQPTRSPRITDRQAEIMTAALCDVIANKKLPADEAQAVIGELIGAMVKQVTRLNEAVAAANNPARDDIKATIDNIRQPVEFRSDAKPEGFAVTKDLEVISLSVSMTGRRLIAVVLFGPDDLPRAESVIRSRIAPNKDDPALRDCLQAAVRRCRESRRSQDEQP